MKRRKVRPGPRHHTAPSPRSFGLTRRKLAVLQVGADKLPNPFNAGFYRYLVEALKRLGANRRFAHARDDSQLHVSRDWTGVA